MYARSERVATHLHKLPVTMTDAKVTCEHGSRWEEARVDGVPVNWKEREVVYVPNEGGGDEEGGDSTSDFVAPGYHYQTKHSSGKGSRW